MAATHPEVQSLDPSLNICLSEMVNCENSVEIALKSLNLFVSKLFLANKIFPTSASPWFPGRYRDQDPDIIVGMGRVLQCTGRYRPARPGPGHHVLSQVSPRQLCHMSLPSNVSDGSCSG